MNSWSSRRLQSILNLSATTQVLMWMKHWKNVENSHNIQLWMKLIQKITTDALKCFKTRLLPFLILLLPTTLRGMAYPRTGWMLRLCFLLSFVISNRTPKCSWNCKSYHQIISHWWFTRHQSHNVIPGSDDFGHLRLLRLWIKIMRSLDFLSVLCQYCDCHWEQAGNDCRLTRSTWTTGRSSKGDVVVSVLMKLLR